MAYSKEQQQQLLNIARQSLEDGLSHHSAMPVDSTALPAELLENRACFVTLEQRHHLRGCIGSLEAHQPLAVDVAENAYRAGFKDPRFPPITLAELAQIDIHISILTTPTPLVVNSEVELLQKLRVGIDGLILQDLGYRSTFLPSVWQTLPTAKEFVEQLKLKAGLPKDYWSSTIHFQIYQSELIK